MKFKITVCIALLQFFVSSNPAALERFFLTSTERIQLDALRYRLNEPKSDILAVDVKHLKLNGMVIRASRKNTIWINGSVQTSQDRGGNYVVKSAGARKNSVPIQFTDHPLVRLRPGQTLDLAESTVKDVYQSETPTIKIEVDTVPEKPKAKQEKNPVLQLKSNIEKLESFISFEE